MAKDGGVAGERADSERPGRKNTNSNVPGTITDAIAVGVGGATILLDETSVLGTLMETSDKKQRSREIE